MKSLNRLSANVTQSKPIKIVQFGTGNFLRGFADWMVDIMNEKIDFDASIQVIKNTKSVAEIDLNAQEGLYHTVLNGKIEGKLVNETRLISCINSVLNPFEDYQKFLEIGLEKNLKLIFSNTTEQGIYFDKTDLNSSNCPESFAAKLTALLYFRYSNFLEKDSDAIAILPTELIENNGEILKNAIFNYVDFWNLDPDFKNYINNNVYFYNTLVDRIVPGFPSSEAIELKKKIGFNDQFMVKAEPYHIWILQGNEIINQLFPAKKAGLNVVLVNDIKPYRTLKVRILNGLHTVMTPVALLRGLKTVKEVMNDNYCRNYIENTVFKEIIPAMNVDENEAIDYAKTVFERYENPYVEHLLQSISLNCISKFRVRVLPSILDYVAKKSTLPQNLIFALTNLILLYQKYKTIESFEIKDEQQFLDFFENLPQENLNLKSIISILENEKLWGQNLNEIQGLNQLILEQISNNQA